MSTPSALSFIKFGQAKLIREVFAICFQASFRNNGRLIPESCFIGFRLANMNSEGANFTSSLRSSPFFLRINLVDYL